MEHALEEARQQLNNIKTSWSAKITALENQIHHLNAKMAEDQVRTIPVLFNFAYVTSFSLRCIHSLFLLLILLLWPQGRQFNFTVIKEGSAVLPEAVSSLGLIHYCFPGTSESCGNSFIPNIIFFKSLFSVSV